MSIREELPERRFSDLGIAKIGLTGLFMAPLREAPTEMLPLLFGHCPFGGGGLDPCQDGLGHLFREELSKFKWAFA